MKTYVSLMRIDLMLAFRNRAVIFFNYLFPFIFFFAFMQMIVTGILSSYATNAYAIAGLLGSSIFGPGSGGAMATLIYIFALTAADATSWVVGMVLVLGILGGGLFGAGMRAVQERESNILRRYKVAPISPLPLLLASMFTGWVIFFPSVVLIVAIAHFRYAMPVPAHLPSFLFFVSLGVVTFRSIGLIVASVVNSTQESNIIIQLLYMPMLFLSGATFPMDTLPNWAQVVSKFLPASYLVSGFRAILLSGSSLLGIWSSVAALLITLSVSTFVSTKLFRWEKEEKIEGKAKLWVLAALLPFIVLGVYQLMNR